MWQSLYFNKFALQAIEKTFSKTLCASVFIHRDERGLNQDIFWDDARLKAALIYPCSHRQNYHLVNIRKRMFVANIKCCEWIFGSLSGNPLLPKLNQISPESSWKIEYSETRKIWENIVMTQKSIFKWINHFIPALYYDANLDFLYRNSMSYLSQI